MEHIKKCAIFYIIKSLMVYRVVNSAFILGFFFFFRIHSILSFLRTQKKRLISIPFWVNFKIKKLRTPISRFVVKVYPRWILTDACGFYSSPRHPAPHPSHPAPDALKWWGTQQGGSGLKLLLQIQMWIANHHHPPQRRVHQRLPPFAVTFRLSRQWPFSGSSEMYVVALYS